MSPATLSFSASNSRRTRNGCQTCKRRRKRCDEKQPVCGACAKLDLKCSYHLPLRWASTRRPFIENRKPFSVTVSLPCDELRQVLQRIGVSSELERIVYSTLRNKEREILFKFLTSGYRTLGSDFKLDNSFLISKGGFAVCEFSRACLTHCLTYQIAIDPAYAHLFDEYYSKSLGMFREEIAGPLDMGDNALYFGGIFMCIISFNHLLPWTNHLHALFSLIQSQIDPAVYCRDKKALEFMSALGFLDLPTHTIGRKTMYHQIWHAYCRGQSGVDKVSGLPFSLLDLLSAIDDLETEGALLSWQPEAGRSAQRRLWEATRYAGVLCVRAKRAEPHQSLPSDSTLGLRTEYLVESVLSSVRQCLARVPPELSHFKQALLYPLVIAAAQRDVLSEPMKKHICQMIQDLASERNFFHYRGVWRVVCEYWAGADESIESTARRLDIELALV